MNKNKVVQILLGISGLLIMSFGLALLTAQPINGAYPIETFNLNLAKVLPFKGSFWEEQGFTICCIFFNAIFIVPLAIVLKIDGRLTKNVWGGLVPAFLLSLPLGFFLSFFQTIVADSVLVNYSLFGLGVVIACFGTALYQASNVFTFSNIEILVYLAETRKKPFVIFKLAFDILTLIGCFILVSVLGPDKVKGVTYITIILTFVPGFLIGAFLKLFSKNKTIASYRKIEVVNE
jgi:uncharacterized membrane protein YczE